MHRFRARSLGVTLLAGLVVLLSGRSAAAQGNLALWQAQPQRGVDRRNDDVLARSSALHFGLTLDPRLRWSRLEGPSELSYGAGVFLSANRTVERARYGLGLHVDNLSVSAASTDSATSLGPSTTGHFGRLGVQRAEVEARGYWLGPKAPNVFFGATVGAYGAGLSLERVDGARQTLGAWPVSAAGGVGYGRLLPTTPRVALALLEQMLVEDGVLDASLEEPVRRALLELWMAHAADLGERAFVVESMAVLYRAGVLRGPLGTLSSYRVERILQTWVHRPIMPRWCGSKAWLALRLSHVTDWTPRPPVSLAIELSGRAVHNRSLTSAVWVAPSLRWAPRPGDRVGAQAAPVAAMPSFAPQPAAALLAPQAVRLELPVGYERALLDRFYNPRGAILLEAGMVLGVRRHAEVALFASGAYTAFFSGTQGVRLALAAAAAATERGPAGQLQLVVAYVQGSGYGTYVMPGPVPSAAPESSGGRRP